MNDVLNLLNFLAKSYANAFISLNECTLNPHRVVEFDLVL